MRHRPRPRALSVARSYAIHSLQLPVLAVIDLLNVLAVRAAFKQGFSPWPPRTRRLSARPRCATVRGARSRQPGPPGVAHTPPAPGPQAPALRLALALRLAPDRPPLPCFSRGEPS